MTAPVTPLSAEQVFDQLGPAYEAAFEGMPEQAASVQWLLSQLDAAGIKRAKFVDIGCGTGKPVCWALAEAGHDVLGIDISGAMITAAKERVPKAEFQQLDIRAFEPGPETFDAATVYFSLIASVSQAEIKSFIAKIYGILKPGGLFVFATVPIPADGEQISWLGKPVVVSSLQSDEAVAVIKEVGFEVELDALSRFTPKADEVGICDKDQIWEEPHLFVYARKPLLPQQ